MLAKPKEPWIPLPKGWQGCVKSAVPPCNRTGPLRHRLSPWLRLAAENGGNTAWIVLGYKCNQRTMEPGCGSCSRVWPTAG